MNKELNLLRYGLILIPAFITMYVFQYEDYERFTLHVLLLLLLVTVGIRLPGRLPLLAGCLEMLFTAWLGYQYGSLMIFPALSALLFYAELQPRWTAAYFTAIHLAVLNVAFLESPPLIRFYINLTFLLTAVLYGLLLRAGRGRQDTLFLYDQLRKKHFELEETRSRLQQFSSQVENAALSEERVRISRQLHDDIGHRLIRVKMMTEAAIQVLPSAPEAGMQMMNQIRDQLSASMDDMRAAVRRINVAPQLEGAYALDRLLEEIGRDTGIETSYQVEGRPYPLYPSIQVVLYKNAREAITNSLRHGKATAVWITLSFRESEVVLEVSNNGSLPAKEEQHRLENGGGMGLKGMTERTRLIGGTLEVITAPRFCLVTRLPSYRQGEL